MNQPHVLQPAAVLLAASSQVARRIPCEGRSRKRTPYGVDPGAMLCRLRTDGH